MSRVAGGATGAGGAAVCRAPAGAAGEGSGATVPWAAADPAPVAAMPHGGAGAGGGGAAWAGTSPPDDLAPGPGLRRIGGLSMGGTWSLVLPAAADAAVARAVVQGVLDRVEAQMSAWRASSDLSRVNATPPGVWVDLPPEMAAVTAAGLALMAEAPGAFSVLLGRAAVAHGFQPGRAGQGGVDDDAAPLRGAPTELSRSEGETAEGCPGREVGAAMAPVREGSARGSATGAGAAPAGLAAPDPAAVELDGRRLRRRADVALDLNALAKGFAADLAVAALARAGIGAVLLEVAGDLRAGGPRPDGQPWGVAVELPIPGRIVPARLIPLGAGAVATSGGYRRARGAASHLIDPQTGAPCPAAGASVAVVAETGLQADGWATVMAVLGPERGLRLAAARGLPVLFLEPDAEGFVERGSPAMARLLGEAG